MIPVMFEAALRALMVALAVWGGMHVMRVSNVRAQKAVWGLVLAAALAMPFLMRWQLLSDFATLRLPAQFWGQIPDPTSAVAAAPSSTPRAALPFAPPRESFPIPESVSEAGDRFPAPQISHSEFGPPNNVGPLLSLYSRQISPVIEPAVQPSRVNLFRVVSVIRLLYLGICAVLLLRLIYGLGSAVRLWLSAEPIPAAPGLLSATGQSAERNLRWSPRIASPVTIGSGIVLPADYPEWGTEKLRIVLAHERSHIRQGDFYLQLLSGLYAALFWFSPLGWWLKHKLCDLGEAISDRAGLEEATSRSSYAQILLEFAALPRPTLIGVAMARTSSLSHRIERLLNDSSFRQAFSGSRLRALLAVLLVPAAVLAATALIRVEAAGEGRPAFAQPAAQAAPQAPVSGSSAPVVAPSAPESPGAQESPAAPAVAPVPPAPPEGIEREIEINDSKDSPRDQQIKIRIERQQRIVRKGDGSDRGAGYSYSFSTNGENYALVSGPGEEITFSGDWNGGRNEDIKKASRMAHGKFLWFMRNGKSYIVEDPAMLGQIETLNAQMDALGRQQEALGRQQEKLGEEQEKLGRQQEQARIPTPDISKEMAKLNEAVAKLQAKKGGTISKDELSDLEGRIGELQGKLGELQGEIGAKLGSLGGLQGQLGGQQGKLGAEQGRIGAEQGRLAKEADRKVKAIIDQSLQNGKARPVE